MATKVPRATKVPMTTKSTIRTKSTNRTKFNPRGFGFICNMGLFYFMYHLFQGAFLDTIIKKIFISKPRHNERSHYIGLQRVFIAWPLRDLTRFSGFVKIFRICFLDLKSKVVLKLYTYGAYNFVTNVREPNKFCKNFACKELVQI